MTYLTIRDTLERKLSNQKDLLFDQSLVTGTITNLYQIILDLIRHV